MSARLVMIGTEQNRTKVQCLFSYQGCIIASKLMIKHTNIINSVSLDIKVRAILTLES